MDASTLAAWDNLSPIYFLYSSRYNYILFLFHSSTSFQVVYHLLLHLTESIHFIPLWSLAFCLILAVTQDYS